MCGCAHTVGWEAPLDAAAVMVRLPGRARGCGRESARFPGIRRGTTAGLVPGRGPGRGRSRKSGGPAASCDQDSSGRTQVVGIPQFAPVLFAQPQVRRRRRCGRRPGPGSAAFLRWTLIGPPPCRLRDGAGRKELRAARFGLAGVGGPGDLGGLQHLGGHLVVGLGVAEPGLAGQAGLVRAVGAGGGAVALVVRGYVECGDDGADFGVGEDDRVAASGPDGPGSACGAGGAA